MNTWDLRQGSIIKSVQNDDLKSPISGVTFLYKSDNVAQMAVNSYDNVLRVYGNIMQKEYRLLHSLTGQKNKNWPIKSSFFSVNDRTTKTNIGYQVLNMRYQSAEDLYAKPEIPSTEEETMYLQII